MYIFHIKRKMYVVMINKYRANFSSNDKLTAINLCRWVSSVNSYPGVCKHYNTYRFRKNLIKRFEKDPVVAFDKKMCVVKPVSEQKLTCFSATTLYLKLKYFHPLY